MVLTYVLTAPGAAVDRLPRWALAPMCQSLAVEADGQLSEAQQWQAAFAIKAYLLPPTTIVSNTVVYYIRA